MSTLRELQERRAELAGLKQMLGHASDEVFEKPLLQSKIAEREQKLHELEREPVVSSPDTELLFSGRAVNGSLGIEAKFASAVLESYQDMISNHHGARLHPGMSGAGKRPGEHESRLYLTALPRGSFGMRLAQPRPDDFIVAQQISEAMEELTSLVESAAAGDAAFAQGVERFHPRVLIPLGNFLETLANRDSSLVIRSGRRETSLDPNQVRSAKTRVAATEHDIDEVNLLGTFRGVLLESWKFDFIPDGQPPICGVLAETVSDTEAQAMVSLCDQHCEALLRRIRFRTHGNIGRPAYELLKIYAISQGKHTS